MTPTALAPASLREGAVVSFDGDTLVTTGAAIVEAIERKLREGAHGAPGVSDRLIDGVPLLVRDRVWIVPLSSVPAATTLVVAGEPLSMRASELAQSVGAECSYGHGQPIGIDLVQNRPYVRALAATDARSALWWEMSDRALVLVRYRDVGERPSERAAIQVVPTGWVSTRRPTPAKKVPRLDLAWSWSDVVALAGPGAIP